MSTEIFDSIFAKNNAQTVELVNDILQSKAYDAIQQRKIDVAQSLFNEPVEQEEEE
jgi:hypothetical protein